MYTYIDLYFNSDGASPREVAARITQRTPFRLTHGPHDFVISWETPEELQRSLFLLHEILAGTGAIFKSETQEEEESGSNIPPVFWLAPGHDQKA